MIVKYTAPYTLKGLTPNHEYVLEKHDLNWQIIDDNEQVHMVATNVNKPTEDTFFSKHFTIVEKD